MLLACIALLGWYLTHQSPVPSVSLERPYAVPPLTQEYTNDEYRFSMNIPADFAKRDLPLDDGTTLIFEDTSGHGLQILITPFDDIRELTEDRVREDLPDLMMTDVQPVEIGSDYRGLAFKSDNDAFGGASREVWFVFRGNLYQISTYEKMDGLLKAVFATWKFY